MLINKENLLRQLDDRPPDGWISIQAVLSMIEGEEDKEDEVYMEGFRSGFDNGYEFAQLQQLQGIYEGEDEE